MPLGLPRLAPLAALLLAPPAVALLRAPAGVPGLVTMPGLEATVFADSAMLTNPTDLDVDARGRVWVLEGYNYRTAMHPENPVRAAGDRVVILEDTNGDGRADREKVFYQGRDVDAAMGIAVLGDRVIVSAYERVLVFTDADGDDRPEKKEVLYTLGPENSDHAVHAFVYGPDGRLYFNVGNASKVLKDAAGNVIVDRAGNRVTSDGAPYRQGMVLRAEADGSGVEVLGHNFRNPYEVAVDAFGTLWQSDNDDDGNRAVRINYVMEYGNYGYTDEMTGAGWSAHRTGIEADVPRRHWHQNDPGVVPNLLYTGAGAPSGIMVYEGALLPAPLRGAMIHADAGVNAVRAYPVRRDGAGYRGEMVDVLKSSTDPMFRPVDVAAAPDGSLFVADWYDPGVGGHDVGDLSHGRIIRVAPAGARYRVTPPDVATPNGAAAALASPNVATRYLAHRALTRAGAAAEPTLARAWRSGDQRRRARALWLLAALPDARGRAWIDSALADTNPDIRITALRAARRGGDGLRAAGRLVDDRSPQVRREAALALRNERGAEAERIWARLAVQHDARDRWYLEALGIGADGKWDGAFAAWRGTVGQRWNTPAGRDVVWRARAGAAVSLLVELIRDAATSPADRLRYLRALDFHRGAERQRALLALLDGADGPVTGAVLAQLDTAGAASVPAVQAALARTLDATRGTQQFVELVRRYDVRDAARMDELLQLALARPDRSEGVDAARLVLRRSGIAPFRAIVEGPDADRAWSALTAIGRAGGSAADAYLESLALSAERPLALRLAAVRLWGPGWGGQQRLLKLAQESKLPADLAPTAAEILRASYRPQVREAAARLFGTPTLTSADGRALPPARELAVRTGDRARGRAVYATACAVCHSTAAGAESPFGPGLGEIGSKLAKEALYTAILHPSSGVAFGYEGTTLRLRDGSEATGIVTTETSDELSLRAAPGLTTRYRKSEIASRARIDRSLMPEGLARGLREQQLVDLVEYLASLRAAER